MQCNYLPVSKLKFEAFKAILNRSVNFNLFLQQLLDYEVDSDEEWEEEEPGESLSHSEGVSTYF